MSALLLALVLVLMPLPDPLAPAGGQRWVRWRHSRQPGRDTDAAVMWVLALAGELRAGSDPGQAVRTSTQRHGLAHRAARAARVGGDVAAALRADAASSGASVLSSVAGAWDLALSTGAGMADVLENMADGYRRTLDVRSTVDVELASPRATARMMSLLPLVGVVLALLLGADPIRWLTTTGVGLACLAAGLALNVAGFVWIQRIVKALEDSA